MLCVLCLQFQWGWIKTQRNLYGINFPFTLNYVLNKQTGIA